jgi:hypothetical protein
MKMTDLRTAAQQLLHASDQGHDIRYVLQNLRAALAQQEQEPVAWVNAAHLQAIQEKAKALGLTLGLYGYVEIYTNESQGRVPLYTHPPRREWQGLTDEDIALIDWESMKTKRDAARAVEQALKERNT